MNALMDARDALRFKLGQLFKECFDVSALADFVPKTSDRTIDIENDAGTHEIVQSRVHDSRWQQM